MDSKKIKKRCYDWVYPSNFYGKKYLSDCKSNQKRDKNKGDKK